MSHGLKSVIKFNSESVMIPYQELGVNKKPHEFQFDPVSLIKSRGAGRPLLFVLGPSDGEVAKYYALAIFYIVHLMFIPSPHHITVNDKGPPSAAQPAPSYSSSNTASHNLNESASQPYSQRTLGRRVITTKSVWRTWGISNPDEISQGINTNLFNLIFNMLTA